MEKYYCVYILASKKDGIVYTGITSDLPGRTWHHKEGVVEGFSKKYWVKRLVWYEIHRDVVVAIAREKQIKKWNRAWKIRMIEEKNPEWKDLYEEIVR